jgi:hypothetical protein
LKPTRQTNDHYFKHESQPVLTGCPFFWNTSGGIRHTQALVKQENTAREEQIGVEQLH